MDNSDDSNSSTWDFRNAPATASLVPSMSRSSGRPRLGRTSSLPRALYSHSSSSIFGNPRPESTQPDVSSERPPTLALRPPSNEHFVSPQPALSTLTDTPQDAWTREAIIDSFTGPSRHLPQVEKDQDDPNQPPSSTRAAVGRHESTTLTTLSRLFAVQTAASPNTSRSPSYTQPALRRDSWSPIPPLHPRPPRRPSLGHHGPCVWTRIQTASSYPRPSSILSKRAERTMA
jgi:hypothetical protein